MVNLNQFLSKMSVTEQGEKQTSPVIISAGISDSAISGPNLKRSSTQVTIGNGQTCKARRFVPTSLTLPLMGL